MNAEMKRYWIVASSKRDPYHWADGKAVLAPIEGNSPTVYTLDLKSESTSFIIPRRYLARWHKTIENHSLCYCQRKL